MKSALLTIGLVISASTASSTGNLSLPAPSTGVINGRDATLVWPGHYRDLKSPPELLPVDTCEVHLLPATDLNAEEIRPCGTWFLVDDGRYRVLLQG